MCKKRGVERWLFLSGDEGVIANQLIFSYDIYANLSAFAQYPTSWVGHGFDGYCFFAI